MFPMEADGLSGLVSRNASANPDSPLGWAKPSSRSPTVTGNSTTRVEYMMMSADAAAAAALRAHSASANSPKFQQLIANASSPLNVAEIRLNTSTALSREAASSHITATLQVSVTSQREAILSPFIAMALIA